MPHAIILGGTGLIGRAVARRLVVAGWQVELCGRDRRSLPSDLVAAGVAFQAIDRADAGAVGKVLAGGTDLLVDCLSFTGQDARALLPHLDGVGSTVMISSKAVYVDDQGRHVNSDSPPRFSGPISESQATMRPGDGDHNSREGYGANKVAAELVLLDSGRPVTVIRASKVHGEGARPAREWVFVKRILDGRRAVFLKDCGASVDHTTAAANLAALVERIAEVPGRRILNSADPDAPSTLEIARTVAAHLDHSWEEVLLPAGIEPELGHTPWAAAAPIVLDTRAAEALGYVPAGSYEQTVATEIDWLVASAEGHGPHQDPDRFEGMFNYDAEDAFLAAR